MNGPYFIETLARNGDVLHRHRVAQLPIRLGRGYDNDFILDDAFAAPRHAVIEADEDGALVLRDLGTKNGVVHRGRRAPSVPLTGDTIVRIGHTSLRVRGADFVVPPEELDRTKHGWEGAPPGLAGALLLATCALFTAWLFDTQSFQLRRYLLALAFAVGAGLVWSGAWAFANRLFGRLARLGRHLFIAGSAVAAVTLYKAASSLLGFAFSLDSLVRYSSHVTVAAAAAAVYFHLKTVKPEQSRRSGIICTVFALIGSSMIMLSNEQRHGRVADELYMPVILPPAARVSPDHPIDDYMGRVRDLKAQLDVERTRKVKDDGSDD
jgi:hypothetical protein